MFAHIHQQMYEIGLVTNTCLDRRSNRLTTRESNLTAFCIQVHNSPIIFPILHPKLDAYIGILYYIRTRVIFANTLSKKIQPVLSLSFAHEQKLWIISALFNVKRPFAPTLTYLKSSFLRLPTFPPNLNYRS